MNEFIFLLQIQRKNVEMFEHKSTVDFSSQEKSSFIAQLVLVLNLIWKVTLIKIYQNKIRIQEKIRKGTLPMCWRSTGKAMQSPQSIYSTPVVTNLNVDWGKKKAWSICMSLRKLDFSWQFADHVIRYAKKFSYNVIWKRSSLQQESGHQSDVHVLLF